MLSILNRSLGIIVGSIFYLIKSLLINLIMIAGLLIISLPITLYLTFVLSYSNYRQSESNRLGKKLIAAFSAGLIPLLLMPLILPIIFTSFALLTIGDIATNTVRGAIEGFKLGTFAVLSSTLTDFLKFSSLLTFFVVIIEKLSERNQVNYQSLTANQAFNIVVEQNRILPWQLLNSKEIQLASKIPMLNSTLEYYLSLCERLEQLDKAIIKRQNDEELDDELVTDEVISLMPITTPVLLVKQYQDEHGLWKAVTGSTNISDFNNLSNSMKACAKDIVAHPRTGEDLINEFVESTGRRCRYCIYHYIDIKRSSQELFQVTNTIRANLTQGVSATPEHSQVPCRASSYPFFNQKIQVNSLDKQESKTDYLLNLSL